MISIARNLANLASLVRSVYVRSAPARRLRLLPPGRSASHRKRCFREQASLPAAVRPPARMLSLSAQIKRPFILPKRTRARSCYHLSSPRAHTRDLCEYRGKCRSCGGRCLVLPSGLCGSDNTLPCNGGRPSQPTSRTGFGAMLRNVFPPAFPAPLIGRQLSVGSCERYSFPSLHLSWRYYKQIIRGLSITNHCHFPKSLLY